MREVPVLNHHNMNTAWGTVGITPSSLLLGIRVREGGQIHTKAALTPNEGAPEKRLGGSGVAWRAKKKTFPIPAGNQAPVVQPIASHYTG
jgi:hypothetical protein